MHRTAARPAPLHLLLPPHPPTVDRRKDFGLAHALPPFIPGYLEAPIRDGLRTPPADDMGTAYQHPQYNNYAIRQDTTYSAPVARGSNYGGSDSYVSTALQPKSHSTLNHQPPSSLSFSNGIPDHNPPSTSQRNSRTGTVVRTEGASQRKGTTNEISPNLRIPPAINNSGGSLAEFAAQITCLFWFESTDILRKAEKTTASSSPVTRLRDEALPSSGFRKWVVTILSTTQVTHNVILLALLFIYRLKTINPAVKGRSGSEYRLLTVALMLGNKFLDDNTYTNKTWAEVSGISVTEIHVMEVEFLSNMRYSLLASEAQWQEWQKKLGSFWIYCDRASRAPYTLPSPTPLSAQSQQSTLPSPPASMQASPPSLTNPYPPGSGAFSPSQSWANHNYSTSLVSPLPLPTMPELQSRAPRKRSHEDDLEEPVAKRLTRSATGHPLSNVPPMMRHDVPRLPWTAFASPQFKIDVNSLSIDTFLDASASYVDADWTTNPSDLGLVRHRLQVPLYHYHVLSLFYKYHIISNPIRSISPSIHPPSLTVSPISQPRNFQIQPTSRQSANDPNREETMTDDDHPTSFADLMSLVVLDTEDGRERFMSRRPCFNPGAGAAYGGTVFAQSVWAASQTNVHGYFTLVGRTDRPYIYTIEHISSGRSYCTRSVTVRQATSPSFTPTSQFSPTHIFERGEAEKEMGQICFSAMCSFKRDEEDGIGHQDTFEKGKYDCVLAGKQPWDFPRVPNMDAPWFFRYAAEKALPNAFPGLDIRRVDMDAFNDSKAPVSRRQLSYYRVLGPMPARSYNLHACAHLYASDRNSLFLISNALGFGDQVRAMGSLSHSVVLHVKSRDLLLGEGQWWCQEARTGRSGGGRGLHESRIWREDGLHVASSWQDGLLRKAEESDDGRSKQERDWFEGMRKLGLVKGSEKL
ncbi:hypothetical protein B7494_g7419 [Chlorociboria aeruginascens]|nr:hypothetical protein B7494_g7419 [Chlorociboria aeruginascens]